MSAPTATDQGAETVRENGAVIDAPPAGHGQLTPDSQSTARRIVELGALPIPATVLAALATGTAIRVLAPLAGSVLAVIGLLLVLATSAGALIAVRLLDLTTEGTRQ